MNTKVTKKQNPRLRKRGFTLIELVVVMAIIAVLALLAAPMFSGRAESARITKAQNDIRVAEDALAVHAIGGGSVIGQPEADASDVLDLIEDGRLFGRDGEATSGAAGALYILDKDFIRKTLGISGWTHKEVYVDENLSVFLEVNVRKRTEGEAGSPPVGIETPTDPEDEIINIPVSTLEGANAEELGYVFNATTQTITGYNGAAMEIEIPKSFLVDGELVEVRIIGASAFQAKGLTEVILPDTLVSIGASAFRSNNIQQIRIHEELTTIANYAFTGNPFTEGVALYANVTGGSTSALGRGPFDGVNIGSRLTIAEGVTRIDRQLFRNAGVTSVSFPSSLTYIGDHAFRSNQVEELIIPPHVTEIGPYAFSGNPLGVGLILEANITGGSTAGLGAGPFDGASLGSRVSVAEGVTRIDHNFFRSAGITSIEFPSSVSFIGRHALRDNSLAVLNLSEAITTISVSSFENNEINRLVIPSGATTIGEYAFSGNPLSEGIELQSNVTGGSTSALGRGPFDGVNIENRLIIAEGVTRIDHNFFRHAHITDVTFPSTLTTIGAHSFRDGSLDSIVIPSNLTSIGTVAFQGNPFQGQIVLQSNVTGGSTSVGASGPFEGAILGDRVTIADGVTRIDHNFFRSAGITSIEFPSSVSFIGRHALRDNSLAVLNLSEAVTTISVSSFENNEINRLVIPSGATTIGEYAFSGNPLSEGIELQSNVTGGSTSATGRGPFHGVNIENRLIIAEGVTRIDHNFFRHAHITDVTFPSTLTTIGAHSFRDGSLDSIVIPSNLTSIGTVAFQGNPFQGQIVLQSNVTGGSTSVGASGPFEGAILGDRVTIADGVTRIDNNFFRNARITHIQLPSSVVTIAGRAFAGNRINQGDAVTAGDLSNISLGVDVFLNNGPAGTETITLVEAQ